MLAMYIPKYHIAIKHMPNKIYSIFKSLNKFSNHHVMDSYEYTHLPN